MCRWCRNRRHRRLPRPPDRRRAKRADRVKIVVWDGSGLVLYWKRLEGSAFKWPPVVDGVMRMNAAQLSALLAGMDWTRMHAPRIPQPKALA
nr:IS66 family insertion sequence element accessory protein TnpB [Bradyrhizobium sp. 166]